MQVQKKTNFYNSISESMDAEASLKNENKFVSVIAAISIYMGSISIILMSLLMKELDLLTFIRGSIVLFVVATFFIVFSRIRNEVVKMYIYAMLISAILIFSYIEFYEFIGPAVMTISFLILMIILIYSRIEMLIIYLVANIVLNIYAWNMLTEFDNWTTYHPAQTMITLTISFASLGIFRVFRMRQEKIAHQYNDIRISEAKLMATLSSVGDGVIAVDEKGIVEYLNPVAETLTGWELKKSYGQRFEIVFRIINEYTRETVESPVQLVFDTGQIIELANHTLLISRYGRERPIEDTAAPIKDKDGKLVGAVLVFRDFSEKKEKRKEIEYLSYCDHMTGLYNRRFLEEELARLDHERNLPFSFVFADINGLKTINDAFGHAAGDVLIQEVATGFKEECRADDIIARTGGDEFVILLPKTDTDSANQMLKRIKNSLEQKMIMDVNISISFGVDTKTSLNQDAQKVLKKAEDLMYQKKIIESASKRSAVIRSIHNTLLIKSPREAAHSNRVSTICVDIAKAYGVDEDIVNELKIAGELHDIGKIAIDEAILDKGDKLTEEEWVQITHHPETGYRLLSTSSEYYSIAEYILAHHERWDGTGYPQRLKGDKISWGARVIAIADAYDAMISDRPYRKAMSVEVAVGEIKKNAGTQFDPDIVDVFIKKVLGL